MGLKCRLLGHQYGDPELERERDENGDEVVVTIREIQVCQRCGAEHVVSENKEITSIRSPEEVGLEETPDRTEETAGRPGETQTAPPAEETPSGPGTARTGTESHIDEAEPDAGATPTDAGAAEADADAGTADSGRFNDDDFEPPEDPDDDDAVILDDEAADRDETQWPDDPGPDPATAARESAAADGEDVDPDPTPDEAVTDDAEFIDADEVEADPGDGAERGHGEWPEREDVDDGSAAWPVQEGEDEGFAAEPSDGTASDVQFGGLAPETNGRLDGDDGEKEYVAVGDDGFARAEGEGELQSDVPDDRIEFYCPNCGHARTAGASSMRAGDICPECKQGYIAEREL